MKSKLMNTQSKKSVDITQVFRAGTLSGVMLCLGLLLTACGGGGGASPTEATVVSVGNGSVLRSAAGPTVLSLPVVFSKNVVSALQISPSIVSPGTTPHLGTAVGGADCNHGADFVVPANLPVGFAAGSSSGTISITVCPTSTFKPDLNFSVAWVSGAAQGVAQALIINSVPGGLASTGAATLMGGAPAFGRDTLALTSSNADGHAGLSYQQITGAQGNCTLDQVTGLYWEVQSGAAQTATYTYSQLNAYVIQVNSAGLCGYTDWRVPTANELMSIVDYSKALAPATDAYGFPNQTSSPYWSSDVRATAPTADAWKVDFSNQGAVVIDTQSQAFRALLVRSATVHGATACTTADARYTDNGDGTVNDGQTGLMWKQCAEGGQLPGCVGTKTYFTSIAQVQAQMAAVNTASSSGGLGYTDWRVPTAKELASLALRNCTSGAVNRVAFPNTDASSHLSATTFASTPSFLWTVDFSDGSVGPVDPTTGGGRVVRLVRAGQ